VADKQWTAREHARSQQIRIELPLPVRREQRPTALYPINDNEPDVNDVNDRGVDDNDGMT